MARTHSPTRAESELPKATAGRLRASILMTATSVFGSVPTTFAVNSRLSYKRTVTLSAPATTWLLVRMKPSAETMNPDPDPCSTCGRRRRFGKKSWNPGGRRWLSSARSTCWDRMNTTDGFTCSATATRSEERRVGKGRGCRWVEYHENKNVRHARHE